MKTIKSDPRLTQEQRPVQQAVSRLALEGMYPSEVCILEPEAEHNNTEKAGNDHD